MEISPLESALNEVEEKTKDLSILRARYMTLAKSGQTVSTNTLSMALNSVTDAPASGGINLYRETFLSPEYIMQNPERTVLVQKLRDAIDEQVSEPIVRVNIDLTLVTGPRNR